MSIHYLIEKLIDVESYAGDSRMNIHEMLK